MAAAGSVSRRSALVRLGAFVTASFGSLWVPRWVGASDLSLRDRIDLLYSNQFHFNRRGEPQITVGLMQGQSRVRLSAPGGLRVLPSGDGGTVIEGGRQFEVRLVRGRPAEQRFTVVVEELVGSDARATSRAADRWSSRGLSIEDTEVGTVFGVQGRVLDNRRVLLTTGDFSSESEAREHARELTRKHGAVGKLHPLVRHRSQGLLEASEAERGLAVRAEGVLWFSAVGDEPITVHQTVTEGTVEDRRYWGSVYVAIDRDGKLAVVNLVSETELLSGLVPAEIYASAPMQALAAQAVAARGQLVSKVGTRHLDDPFLLCSEQHCQVYAGMIREHPRTNQAVRDTAGHVAMRPGGSQLVDTVYSANCGGHTEDNEAVWPSPKDAQLRGRADPLLATRFADGVRADDLEAWLRGEPRSYSKPARGTGRAAYRWTEAVDPAAIAGRENVPDDFGAVERIEVLHRGRSGRATAMRIFGRKRELEVEGELRIRRALGGLKSSMFVVEPERDGYGRFVLRGGGHGHGVGLCQHGAMGMAEAGWSYRKILAHYYSGAEILELW